MECRAWGNTLRVQHIATRTGEPLRYQGHCFDAETGLHCNCFRYYDPDAGVFISQDPAGTGRARGRDKSLPVCAKPAGLGGSAGGFLQ
ncbi:RHS repeat-associated core domain-containing protein [Cronobacter dublinensis]